ncbi:39S ribosomal protein L22, mitochondrial [Chiloscyllium plagiosum]|uniref:39S ribosomal protein L22, mitochondrial n=1 Tax=Chiloscyllium plagiosum TaxID=36176 RepID=UPI001CB7CB49|nr:39S ribosomal protein L22, mitochondrial [Chiloscyllium plagiosum]
MAGFLSERMNNLWILSIEICHKLQLCFASAYRLLAACSLVPQSHIHSSLPLPAKNWERKNRVVYPPQLPDEPRRPVEVYHCRRQIKYSKDKMWYLAKMIRGMTFDQAVAQLQFNDKKGAKLMLEVLLEAQEMAVRNHNLEYRSNLYVAESFSSKGQYLKRIRYHGRGMFGIMDRVYCHYFVKLVEGSPPVKKPTTGFDQAKEYVQQLRNRTIIHSL